MLQLLVFVVGVVGIGWLIGATNLPGEWYAALAKPGFVPSNWAFPVAWTILYIMIAVAGWRTFRREPSGRAMQVFFLRRTSKPHGSISPRPNPARNSFRV